MFTPTLIAGYSSNSQRTEGTDNSENASASHPTAVPPQSPRSQPSAFVSSLPTPLSPSYQFQSLQLTPEQQLLQQNSPFQIPPSASAFAFLPPPQQDFTPRQRQQEESGGALTSLRSMFQKKIGYLTLSADQQWSIIGDKLLREPEVPIVRTKQLSRLVRRFGVPDSIRAAFWMNVSGATAHNIQGKGEYWHTVNVIFAKQQHALWAENAGQPKTADMLRLEKNIAEIETDVKRVSAFDSFFATPEGRDQLRRLLTVYSERNPAVGYCQMMYIIAGMLLTKLPEEEAFWMFKTIVDDIIPPNYLTDGMTGLLVDVQVFCTIARQQLPRLMDELDKESIVLDLFLIKWFPVMFLGCVSEHVGDRILDLVVYKGFKVLFRVTLALLSMVEDEIRQFDSGITNNSNNGNEGSDEAAETDASSQSVQTISDTSSNSKTSDVSRAGFIMSTLQNLPKQVSEVDLIERTFNMHAHSLEIENLRRSIRQKMGFVESEAKPDPKNDKKPLVPGEAKPVKTLITVDGKLVELGEAKPVQLIDAKTLVTVDRKPVILGEAKPAKTVVTIDGKPVELGEAKPVTLIDAKTTDKKTIAKPAKTVIAVDGKPVELGEAKPVVLLDPKTAPVLSPVVNLNENSVVNPSNPLSPTSESSVTPPPSLPPEVMSLTRSPPMLPSNSSVLNSPVQNDV